MGRFRKRTLLSTLEWIVLLTMLMGVLVAVLGLLEATTTAQLDEMRIGALTVGYFAVTVARPYVAEALQDHLGVAAIRTAVAYAPLVSAIVLFALAEIWQRGVELRDEQQLTV